MNINGRFMSEPETQAYINSLLARNEELESKHELECMQIAHYSDELAKAKELLARVPEMLNNLCFAVSEPAGCEFCPYGNTNSEGECDVEKLINDIEQGHNGSNKSAYPWISVKDKLPEEDECIVLVWIESGKANGIQYENFFTLAEWVKNGSAFCDNDWNEITGITHWMYSTVIPEPTKEGDTNG